MDGKVKCNQTDCTHEKCIHRVSHDSYGSSLAGTANCVQRVAEYFEKKNSTTVETKLPSHIRTPSAYHYSCPNCDCVRGIFPNPDDKWVCSKCGSLPKIEEVLYL